MQLALLSGASPILCKQGPVVRLQAGTWEITVDGLKDSSLVLHRDSHDPIEIKQGRQFIHLVSSEVRADFVTRGSERFITVNVKRVA